MQYLVNLNVGDGGHQKAIFISFMPFFVSLHFQTSLKRYKTKKAQHFCVELFDVGVARFELATSCSQSRRDTGLRYTPKKGLQI